jgi:hypothetical protein
MRVFFPPHKKVPSERLGWPDLLNHPFIQETEEEKGVRVQRQEKYNHWAGLEIANIDLNENTKPVAPKADERKYNLKLIE